MNSNSPIDFIKKFIKNINNQLTLIYFIFIFFIFSLIYENTFSQIKKLILTIIPINVENYLMQIFSYHVAITKLLLFINFIGWLPAVIMVCIILLSYSKNFNPDFTNNNIFQNLLLLSNDYIHVSFIILLLNMFSYILFIGDMNILGYFSFIFTEFKFLSFWLLLTLIVYASRFKNVDLNKPDKTANN